MLTDMNDNSKLPKYQQLRNEIARGIKSGEITNDERLLSERALANKMGFARMTVREALLMLEGEGLISRRENRGWYVDSKRIRYNPVNHLNMYKLIKKQGGEPGNISFGWHETKASSSIARMMNCDPGTELLFHSSVVLWDDRKIAYDENYLLKSYFPEFLASEYKPPITDFLDARFGVLTKQVGFRARPTPLYGLVSKKLDVTAGSPGIFITRTKAHNKKIVQVDRDFWLSGGMEIVVGQFPH